MCNGCVCYSPTSGLKILQWSTCIAVGMIALLATYIVIEHKFKVSDKSIAISMRDNDVTVRVIQSQDERQFADEELVQKLMAKVNANEGLITDLKSQLLIASKVGLAVSPLLLLKEVISVCFVHNSHRINWFKS